MYEYQLICYYQLLFMLNSSKFYIFLKIMEKQKTKSTFRLKGFDLLNNAQMERKNKEECQFILTKYNHQLKLC